MLTGQIILQIIVILLVAQPCAYLCKRMGQQWVIGEIIAGLILGPSLLGTLWPGFTATLFPAQTLPTLQTLGDLGLILYMFSLGARLDTHLILSQSRNAIVISLSGIIVPLSFGIVLAFFLFPTLAGPKTTLLPFALLIGTAMSITAFPVLARLLMEKQLLGTKVGMLALTCASIDDVLAWCFLALVVATIRAQGGIAVLLVIGEVVLFCLAMLFLVRPLLHRMVRHIRSLQLQITLAIAVLLLAAYSTNAIGIHPIFGAFLAGIILPRNVAFTAHIRGLDQINNTLFLPLFFVVSGLRTQIGFIQSPTLWGICLLVFLVACAGKFLSATFATRLTGNTWHESVCLGLLMNTRGLVELIVLNIGLELKVLSPTLFAMLVVMALATTMMASPLLSLLGWGEKKTAALPTEEVALSQET